MRIIVTEAQFKKLMSMAVNESIGGDPVHELYYEIGEKAKAVVDYLYNEGVIDYDDEHLSAMVKDMSLINFKDICRTIMSEYGSELTDDEYIVISDYIKTGSNPELEDQILRGIKEYEKKAHRYFSADDFRF